MGMPGSTHAEVSYRVDFFPEVYVGGVLVVLAPLMEFEFWGTPMV